MSKRKISGKAHRDHRLPKILYATNGHELRTVGELYHDWHRLQREWAKLVIEEDRVSAELEVLRARPVLVSSNKVNEDKVRKAYENGQRLTQRRLRKALRNLWAWSTATSFKKIDELGILAYSPGAENDDRNADE